MARRLIGKLPMQCSVGTLDIDTPKFQSVPALRTVFRGLLLCALFSLGYYFVMQSLVSAFPADIHHAANTFDGLLWLGVLGCLSAFYFAGATDWYLPFFAASFVVGTALIVVTGIWNPFATMSALFVGCTLLVWLDNSTTDPVH